MEDPFWGPATGYQWFEDGQGYFEGIMGDGEVQADLYELEMEEPMKFSTVQHSWGTINIGDPE